MKNAFVSIIGAGPGDPGLMTLNAVRALKKSKLILYDALIGKEILDWAPRARKIFVGKRAGQKCMSQDSINYCIVENALKYGHVARLKGGDPFIFGRGHEELNYVRSFGIEVELIPGISSATSLPLLQGVALTKRKISESFWVLTGSTRNHELSHDIRIAAQSTATLVILMGIRKLKLIAEILSDAGKSETGIMIIQSGSTANEKCLTGRVYDVEKWLKTEYISTPGIIVVGDVVLEHPALIKHKYLVEWNK